DSKIMHPDQSTRMSKHIALISEHASPLSLLGGVDSGGQNVYVGQLARNLAALGHQVDVFTRRDGEGVRETERWLNGVRVIHVPAGRPRFVRKEEMLPLMGPFTAYMLEHVRQRSHYDLPPPNFW